MIFPRLRLTEIGGLVAPGRFAPAGVAAACFAATCLLAGCEQGTTDAPPVTNDDRSVYDPTAVPEENKHDVSPTVAATDPNADSPEKRPVEPVVAMRPANVSTENAAGNGSTAMSISDRASTPGEDDEPVGPMITDPNADASQYPGGVIPASPNAQPLPGGPRLLVPERTFRNEGRPRALRVSYDDLDLLRVLNMGSPLPADAVDQFPDWLKELDGKRIRLRGFMYPSFTQEMKNFVLTRDTGECCFGPNPRVYYLIGVKLKEGTTVSYIGDRPFDVVGTFHIQPVYNDGTWYQIYKIDDAVVEK